MNTKNLKARVKALLDPDLWISSVDIAARLGMSVSNARYYLEMLVAAGEAEQDSMVVRCADSKASSRRYTYRLAVPVHEAPARVTLPAYRNLRLGETLTGYERENNRFAALCMLARK